MRTRTLAAIAASSLLIACSDRGELRSTGTGLGPLLVPIDSVILQETPDDFVSVLSGFVVGSTYDSYINDPPTGRVLHFDATGQLAGSFGRKGDGPGEMEGVTMLALDGDSVLHALDWGNQRVVAFRTGTGEVAGQRAFPLRTWSIDADAGRLALGAIDITRHSSVSVILPETDSIHAIGPFPEIFDRAPPMSSAFGMSQVLLPMALGRIAPTRYAVVTIDPVVENNHWSGAVYLSVVDAAARRSCVDAELPVPADPVPQVAFRGDTVFVLAQHITTDATATTVIHRYRIDTAQCDWLPEPATG